MKSIFQMTDAEIHAINRYFAEPEPETGDYEFPFKELSDAELEWYFYEYEDYEERVSVKPDGSTRRFRGLLFRGQWYAEEEDEDLTLRLWG